ncbi:UNVERIFIED_CONTAM: hypothetical protein Cloal_4182 [Acetivibrio alkalicellulosi]
MVDPKNPGAVDEIIHLGDFWDEDEIRINKDKIIKCNKDVGNNFKRAYKYIRAAYLIYEDSIEIIKNSTDSGKINQISNTVFESIFKNTSIAEKEGSDRRLFASAITPKGLINYLDTVLNTSKIYNVRGKSGTGTEKFLEKIKIGAIERGLNVESFYCALNPFKLEHLIIRDLDVSFTTSNEYHSVHVEAFEEIDFDECIDRYSLNELVLEENRQNFSFLLGVGIQTIAKAKSMHDDMEAYYIPNMDFEAVQLCFESTLARILK